ncbi:MAG: hypothetical protein B7Y56_13390 [Gallionellales bacterium 35-53-114]|jgi:hypothetical protein|nr:MAG: hypothetical protein B7Y56_13390 [Gallionellales bacterium 35-53-114]OYZ63070.1 MAG: hypothetical protein B7Y04_11425 [Gallionellales bacterium 24-53-125]OZB08949.1 MAG: hypothetical protein B7X61_08175 [Gallionellales bacterium 39-52-133]HQS59378.1 hypothetical protein [Gallionellaceae bacterium]HQS76291.1 hypothetical protein [Gallionellaceae bacterium]
MKLITLLFGLLFFQTAIADDTDWIGGIYIDTVNSINIKGGIVLNDNNPLDPDRPHYYGSFKYTDLELGLGGSKISFGFGDSIGHGLNRIGLSYAHLRSQDMAGFEWIVSQMGGSFKLGYYWGLDGTKNQMLLGFGLGF